MRAFLVLNWSGISLIVSAVLVGARIITARCGQARANSCLCIGGTGEIVGRPVCWCSVIDPGGGPVGVEGCSAG